jgi:hypothetical protein
MKKANISDKAYIDYGLTALVIFGLSLLICGKHFGSDILSLFAYLCFFLIGGCGLSRKLSVRKLRYLLPIFFLFFVPLVSHYIIYGDLVIFYILHYSISIFIGFYASNIFDRIKWNLVLYVYCGLTIILIQLNVSSDLAYLNRTYYTVPVAALLVCSVIANYYKRLGFDVRSLIVNLVVAVFSLNRASLLLTVALLLLYLVYKLIFDRKTILSLIINFSLVIFTVVSFSYLIGFIVELGVYQRLLDRGLDSNRFSIWYWYVSQITFKHFLIGADADLVMASVGQLFFRVNDNYSLHNVLLHVHMQGGIFASLFVIYLFGCLMKPIIYGKDRLLVIAVIGMLFIKSLVEITMFPQFTDWLYFVLYFYTAEAHGMDYDLKKSQHLSNAKH